MQLIKLICFHLQKGQFQQSSPLKIKMGCVWLRHPRPRWLSRLCFLGCLSPTEESLCPHVLTYCVKKPILFLFFLNNFRFYLEIMLVLCLDKQMPLHSKNKCLQLSFIDFRVNCYCYYNHKLCGCGLYIYIFLWENIIKSFILIYGHRCLLLCGL